MERETNAPDLYEREEQCVKSIRTVRRAVLMRILVAAILVCAVAGNPTRLAVWGLAIFVLVVDIVGALPLIAEWKKQKQLLKDLIAQEE